MPIVSVIVPVYNTMQWLAECVESIRCQTLQNIEIILVDDGSTDYSGAICDAYAEADSRIRVIHQENSGVSVARNVGMDIASGKYIMFCDSDDYAAPEWCAELMVLAEKNPKAWVSSGYSIVNVSGIKELLYDKENDYSIIKYGNYLQLYKSGLADDAWNKIYRKDIIVKYNIRFQETVSFGEDTLFTTDYWKRMQYGFVRNINPLYYYRQWGVNTLSSHIDGIGRFRSLTKKIAALRLFMSESEEEEFLKNTFWRSSRYCLWHILNPQNCEFSEDKLEDCKSMIKSPEFQEWYMAVADEKDNPWVEAIRKMDFQLIYDLLLEYYMPNNKE